MKEEIKNHALVKFGNQFNDLTQQVFKNTSINFVAVTRIYNNNTRSYLMSDPAVGEMLLTQKYRLIKTDDELNLICKQPHHLWRVSNMFFVDQETKRFYEDCVEHNYSNGVTLIEKGKDFVELLHLGAKTGSEVIDPYLMHNIDKLWNQVLHIRQLVNESHDLKKSFDTRYDFKMDNPSRNIIPSNNILSLKQYDLGGYFDGIKFTNREIQCLCLMQREISAKKVARLMGISYRSVEAIMHRIMTKTKINNKYELLLKLANNNAFLALY